MRKPEGDRILKTKIGVTLKEHRGVKELLCSQMRSYGSVITPLEDMEICQIASERADEGPK